MKPWLGGHFKAAFQAALGESRESFIGDAVGALQRLLPHVDVTTWQAYRGKAKTSAKFPDARRRSLKLQIGLDVAGLPWHVQAVLKRKQVPRGIGAVARTIDLREQDLALQVLSLIEKAIKTSEASSPLLGAFQAVFDERVVAAHLRDRWKLTLSLEELFAVIRQLSEESYENKSITFACVIDAEDEAEPDPGWAFPADFLRGNRKKYRALTDGYRTAYLATAGGALKGFIVLDKSESSEAQLCPEWCIDLAEETRRPGLAVCLTRQGDVLVLEGGRLTFSYRRGHWQYWNHAHLIDLMRNACRVQHVAPGALSRVVRALYRATLDVAFRRTGGLFVLLRNRNSLGDIVRDADRIGDATRDDIDAMFDSAISSRKIVVIPRAMLSVLAGLDGAIVLNNAGSVLAYGAVLQPRRQRGISGSEGSRSKAAIGASHYGLAIKISSDGDVKVLLQGAPLFKI